MARVKVGWLADGKSFWFGSKDVETYTDASGGYVLQVPDGVQGAVYVMSPSSSPSSDLGKYAVQPSPQLPSYMIAGGGGLVLSGDRQMDLTLMPMHTVRVRVVDGNTNAPVQGAKISTNPSEKTCNWTASGFAGGWRLFPGASENSPSQLGPGYFCFHAPAGMGTEPRTDANGYVDLVVIDGSVNGLNNLTVAATHPLDGGRVGVVSVATNADSSPTVLIPGTPSIPAQPVVKTINGEVQLSWTEPWHGGAFIDYYKVWVATDASGPYELVTQGSCAGKISPELRSCSVSGLTQDVTYYFAIIAHNEVGYSARSTATALRFVIPEVPDAPSNVSATIANQSAEVSWLPPANDGDSPILDYTVSWATGSKVCTASPCTITGLINGNPYAFQVAARNFIGPGSFSNLSSAVTPITIPGPPTNMVGTIANSQSVISWTAPASTGGSAITGYTVTSTPGSFTCATTSTSCTVTGLTNGTAYTFTATATNAAGVGLASIASSSITPITTPGTPTIGTVTRTNNTTISVLYTAPSANGAAVTAYTVTASPSITLTLTSSATANPLTFTGSFVQGQEYSFTIAATNAAGTSEASVASISVTPFASTALGTSTVRGATPAVPEVPGNVASVRPASPDLPATSPGKMILINAKSHSKGKAIIRFGNTSVTGEKLEKFEFRRSLDGGKTWTPWKAVKSGAVTSGWKKASTYRLQVRAVNNYGPGSPATISFKPTK